MFCHKLFRERGPLDRHSVDTYNKVSDLSAYKQDCEIFEASTERYNSTEYMGVMLDHGAAYYSTVGHRQVETLQKLMKADTSGSVSS